MSSDHPRLESNGQPPRHSLAGDNPGDIVINADEFERSFGENIHRTLDLSTWRIGSDLSGEYSRIEREVFEAVRHETSLEKRIRDEIFPRLSNRDNAPKNAGKHKADMQVIERIHRGGLLFNGGVEACRATSQVHDTLPLTIYQIGVTLVSYRGDQGTWCQRLFRKDLRQKSDDRVAEASQAIDLLEQRSRHNSAMGDALGELARKVIVDYAERAILLNHSQAKWRMGHGNPVTYELLTGGGNLELMVEATNAVRGLIEDHQKFVFVGHQPRERLLLTIGQALRPMEFAIVSTLDERIEDWLRQKRFSTAANQAVRWDDEEILASEWIPRFIGQVASKVVIGLFRATRLAPAQMFFAHQDHADLAAHIVLADSMLQEQHGFPLLAEIASRLCNDMFLGSLDGLAEAAYAAAGAPWRYLGQQ